VGFAGALYAHYFRFITPEQFEILQSSAILTMVGVGGLRTTWGPVIGALLLRALPQALSCLQLPPSVLSGKTFEAWRRDAETRDRKVLFLSLADLLVEEDRELSPDRYPDELMLGGTRLPLAYRFDPGEDDDGITMTVPLAVLPQLDPAVMAWTIPGWHRAKLVA
jgi:hypothetical protein